MQLFPDPVTILIMSVRSCLLTLFVATPALLQTHLVPLGLENRRWPQSCGGVTLTKPASIGLDVKSFPKISI